MAAPVQGLLPQALRRFFSAFRVALQVQGSLHGRNAPYPFPLEEPRVPGGARIVKATIGTASSFRRKFSLQLFRVSGTRSIQAAGQRFFG